MGQNWVADEISECDLGDARLNRRLGAMLEALGDRPGSSLPTAFQDWANTKAAYRFFANENVSEDKILEGHFNASALRIQATDGPILILQDTTEFTFKRAAPEKIGFTHISTGRKMEEGRHQKHAICGLLMHASLAVTPDGLPLGLTAAKFWSRSKFKGTAALKRKINPTRVPIEHKESMRWLDNLRLSTKLTGAPERCVHIGDRESDIYELYCLAQDLGTNFLVRSCVDRLAEDGATTIAQVMAKVQSSGTHKIRFRDAAGIEQRAVLALKHATMTVRPPIGKQKKYQHQTLQIIHAEELDPPENRAPVLWKLITNLPVENHTDAVHKLNWYARRWTIETFFKTLKSGCRIENFRLTTADRLANCIALCCVVAWRVSWLAILRRQSPAASPAAVFTEVERVILDRAMPPNRQGDPRDLAFYMTATARLGGYLDRKSDPPPGTTVIWRGYSRLADLTEGFIVANEGNAHKNLWVIESPTERLRSHNAHPLRQEPILATNWLMREADWKNIFAAKQFRFQAIPLESLMFDPENTDNAASFAREFLEKYSAVGFGALSKREVDLLLVQLLQKHLPGFQNKSDFDAALTLRTTKRKIRGLRDEVSFREAKDEDYLNINLRSELKRAEVLPSEHGTVKIQLDDAVLRGYAEKIVRSEFGIVDSSFNSAILQLSGEKYLLLCLTVLTTDERAQAERALGEFYPDQPRLEGQHGSLFAQLRRAFVVGAGEQAGKLCVSGAMALVTGGASIFLESAEPLTDAGRGIGRALQQAWNYFTQEADAGE